MALSKKTQEDLEYLRSLRRNPNAAGFLNLIAKAEGTLKYGYNTNFGGSFNADLSAHPNVRRAFKQTDGKQNYSTASGRYQFIKSTWDGKAKKFGLTDFGAESQDIAALDLIRDSGALKYVLAGDYRKAIDKVGGVWASMPSAPAKYKQPKKTYGDLLDTPVPTTLGGAIMDAPASVRRAYEDVFNQYQEDLQPLSFSPSFAQTQTLTKGMSAPLELSPLGAMTSTELTQENMGAMTPLSAILSNKK